MEVEVCYSQSSGVLRLQRNCGILSLVEEFGAQFLQVFQEFCDRVGSGLGTVPWEARASRRFGCEARSFFYIKFWHCVVFFEEFVRVSGGCS